MKGTADLRINSFLVFCSITSTAYPVARLFWMYFTFSDNYLKAVLFFKLAWAKLLCFS